MNKENIDRLEKYIDDINKRLDFYTGKTDKMQNVVVEAMNYALSAGGKRIRPILMLEFYRICGGKCDIIDISCCIEMIHTFSLIHDDLPCMDNDDYRRGKPSCHKVFGEDIALLAGDSLNTLPYEIISGAGLNGLIDIKTALKLINVLSKSVGTNGMIGGQIIDMISESKSINEDKLYLLQELKTGALIEASCLMGCILANADENMISNALSYAKNLGLAFQITDDILDVTGTFEQLGKNIGSDAKSEKSTFVTLFGLEKSQEIASDLTNQAINSISRYKESEFLIDLTKDLLLRKN